MTLVTKETLPTAAAPYKPSSDPVIEIFYHKAAAGRVRSALLVAEQQLTYSSNNMANESARVMLPD